MIFAMLMLIQVAAASPLAPTDDVVVLGQRLKGLKLHTKTDRKTRVTRCVFKRHSGDPALDDMVCAALLDCGAKVKTEAAMTACLVTAMRAQVPEAKWQPAGPHGRD